MKEWISTMLYLVIHTSLCVLDFLTLLTLDDEIAALDKKLYDILGEFFGLDYKEDEE